MPHGLSLLNDTRWAELGSELRWKKGSWVFVTCLVLSLAFQMPSLVPYKAYEICTIIYSHFTNEEIVFFI